MTGSEFRWRYFDAALGNEWSDWHAGALPCPACCCGGPEEGEHLEGSEYYDEDGFLSNGHTRCDPAEDDWQTIEWRTPAAR